MTSSHQMQQSETQRPTLDEEEVKKFSKIADSWWDARGEFAALQTMNELRVPLIRDGLMRNISEPNSPSRPLKGKSILDVGCGGGILAEVSPGRSVVSINHFIHQSLLSQSLNSNRLCSRYLFMST